MVVEGDISVKHLPMSKSMRKILYQQTAIISGLSDVQRFMIISARLVGVPVFRTAIFMGFSRTTESRFSTACIKMRKVFVLCEAEQLPKIEDWGRHALKSIVARKVRLHS